MFFLTDASQSKELDRHTIEEFGLPSLLLMERAALSAAGYIQENFRRTDRVYILAGCGNNGADGLALARILSQRGFEIKISASGNIEKATEEWKFQKNLLDRMDIFVDFLNAGEQIPCGFDLYVDALFGIGLSRDLSADYIALTESFNRAVSGSKKAVCLALDMPSGINATTAKVCGAAVKADVTVTFGTGKLGQYLFPGAYYCGKVIIADIGLDTRFLQKYGMAGIKPDPVFRAAQQEDISSMIGRRLPWGNKGTFGSVLVIAGGPGMVGAAFFSASAAYRTGCGLVRILTAEQNRPILQAKLPEAVICVPEEGESLGDAAARELDRCRAAVVGPGLTTGAFGLKLVEALLHAKPGVPVVLDADALNLLKLSLTASDPGNKILPNYILTPHPGELARLLQKKTEEVLTEGIPSASLQLWQRTGAVCVCKDARSVIRTNEGTPYLNVTGNDGMGVGGSGDVLAGLIAGLAAQGLSSDDAACAGVYCHGLSGDLAAAKYGRHGMTASNILEFIPEVLKIFE